MPSFALSTIPSHYSITPLELGPWLEAQGFESVWFGEHSHIPTSRKTPFIVGGELPEWYRHFFDPFIGLTAVAAVTKTLKVGTAICLVTEHHPINLAKMISCLDQVSKGRLLLGIGAGWNAEEIEDYGIAFKDRWKIVRERVLAMREIWNNDVAEYHGEFVNFDPMWSWPKPVQAGGPPILMGAASKVAAARIADYCDGWIPVDLGADLKGAIDDLRVALDKRGRALKDLDLSVLMNLESAAGGMEKRIGELLALGFNRIVFRLPTEMPDKQWPVLERYAKLLATLK